MTDKATARKLLRQRRAFISMIERAELSARISEKAITLPEFARAKTVMAYVSIRDEVITGPLLRYILDTGRTLALPRVEDGRIRGMRAHDLSALRRGAMGIPEPEGEDEISPGDIDLFLLPGLGFDPMGGRIGYGKGYFDAYLKDAPGYKAGLCFEAQMMDRAPVEEYDVAMDAVVTETQIYRCGRTL